MQEPDITFEHVLQARRRLEGQIARTPFLHSRTLSDLAGCQLHLKFENLQFTASFKERGAGNRLARLTDAERARGVIAVSAGNHAQGVAYHARRLGIRAVIVMPRFTPQVKRDNTQRLGAEVVLAGESLAAAREAMQALATEQGLVVVPPYDDADVIAGQGTVGLEMLKDVPDLEVVVVPVGGGGLLAGIALAARARSPAIELVGVQAEMFPAASRAFARSHGAGCAAGAPSADATVPAGGPTIADGIAVEQPGRLTMPIICRTVDRFATVSEADLERAIVMLLEIEKTVVEGAGAAGLAAVLADPSRFAGRKVGLVLSGGNIDPLTLSDIIQRSLVRSRRLARLTVSARDTPGSLARIATILAEQDANIEEVTHQRAFADLPVRYARIDLVVSTRGADHLRAVVAALSSAGFVSRVLDT
jgi:threonine dehydratase